MRAWGSMGVLYIWYVCLLNIECKPNLSFLRVKVSLALNFAGSVYIIFVPFNMLYPAILTSSYERIIMMDCDSSIRPCSSLPTLLLVPTRTTKLLSYKTGPSGGGRFQNIEYIEGR